MRYEVELGFCAALRYIFGRVSCLVSRASCHQSRRATLHLTRPCLEVTDIPATPLADLTSVSSRVFSIVSYIRVDYKLQYS